MLRNICTYGGKNKAWRVSALPIVWCNSVFCNTRKWKVLRSYHQTVAFILCQKKKPQKHRRRPLNVSRGQFAVSQITCLLPPVTQFPSPPADSANKKRSKEEEEKKKVWALKDPTSHQKTSTCFIHRPRGAEATVHHSGAQPLWERKLTTWLLTHLQVNSAVGLFPGFKNKKVHTSPL